MTPRSKPWVMRTYSGHSSAVASNELYRANLAKGQTGLSIAFDLPTQTGYDPDDPAAAGEVGKVGVPVAHLGHMRQLFEGLPLAEMNTSMTINATAAWLWGLYLALAEEEGVDLNQLQGTTQNDIVKEYLSRGTYIFAPEPSKRLIVDMIAYGHDHVAKWNPINVCSYHLQEAGATPVQEIAYSLATAIDVLDAVRDSGKIEPAQMPHVVGQISFFVNAGVRFIEEIAKMRTFTPMWDEICRTRYGVEDPSLRRFRYGVQVNSLGLTEQQPENNVQRIVLEMLGVTLSADARARALQLPAWNEALGLPRPADQQWSLRMQQVLAFESDLLEYPDIFAGSSVMEAKVHELTLGARDELEDVLALGGAFSAIEELKSRLVASQSLRVARIESGEQVVVGVNRFTETAESPLTSDNAIETIMTVDPAVERQLIDDVVRWRVVARPGGRRRGARRARSRGEERRNGRQHHGAHDRPGQGRRHDRRMGQRPARGLRGVPRAHRCARRRRRTRRTLRDARRALEGGQRPPRSAAETARRQTGTRRPLQRRRADRRRGARRGIRSRLSGHPTLPRGDRRGRARRGRRRHRSVDTLGLAPGSRAAHPRVPARERPRRPRSSSVASCRPEDAASLLDSGVVAVYTPKDFSLAAIMSDLLGIVEGLSPVAVDD